MDRIGNTHERNETCIQILSQTPEEKRPSQKMFAQTEGYNKMETEERGCEGAKLTPLPHARNQ